MSQAICLQWIIQVYRQVTILCQSYSVWMLPMDGTTVRSLRTERVAFILKNFL